MLCSCLITAFDHFSNQTGLNDTANSSHESMLHLGFMGLIEGCGQAKSNPWNKVLYDHSGYNHSGYDLSHLGSINAVHTGMHHTVL